jgi:hypothetical protein
MGGSLSAREDIDWNPCFQAISLVKGFFHRRRFDKKNDSILASLVEQFFQGSLEA